MVRAKTKKILSILPGKGRNFDDYNIRFFSFIKGAKVNYIAGKYIKGNKNVMEDKDKY